MQAYPPVVYDQLPPSTGAQPATDSSVVYSQLPPLTDAPPTTGHYQSLPPTPIQGQYAKVEQIKAMEQQRTRALQKAAQLQRTKQGGKLQRPIATRPSQIYFTQLPQMLTDWYKVDKVLGQGQFGRVLLAKDRKTGQQVALKEILRQETPQDKLDVDLELLALLKATGGHPRCHPNVVCYYGHFEALPSKKAQRPVRYIAMEFVAGQTLDKLKPNKLSSDDRLNILRTALAGLAFLHSHNIAHRDIKPANIIVRRNPTSGRLDAVLVDLGLSCFQGQTRDNGAAECSIGAGSEYYMAPELRDKRLPYVTSNWMRGDIYSLGVSLHPLLGGLDLVQLMLQPEPQHRPTAAQLLGELQQRYGS